MDPITAWALAITEALKLAGKCVDGQTPAQQAYAFAWVIDLDRRLRHLLHIPEVPPVDATP